MLHWRIELPSLESITTLFHVKYWVKIKKGRRTRIPGIHRRAAGASATSASAATVGPTKGDRNIVSLWKNTVAVRYLRETSVWHAIKPERLTATRLRLHSVIHSDCRGFGLDTCLWERYEENGWRWNDGLEKSHSKRVQPYNACTKTISSWREMKMVVTHWPISARAFSALAKDDERRSTWWERNTVGASIGS